MIKKTFLLCVIALMLSLVVVYAAPILTLVSPEKGVILGSSTVTHTFWLNGTSPAANSYNCTLYTTENGTNGVGGKASIEVKTSIANTSGQLSFTNRINIADVAGAAYTWNVSCFNGTNGTGLISTNATYGVDTAAPNITILSGNPTKGGWETDGTITIGLKVDDFNANTCNLSTTLNSTGNSTRVFGQVTSDSYTNVTAFNFTGFDMTENSFADNNTGNYIFSYVCDDDAGNTVNSTNITFYIDTVDPTLFDFDTTKFNTTGGVGNNISNGTTATDYTPIIGWNITTELNFSRYELNFYTDEALSAGLVQTNVTTKTTLSTAVSELLPNQQYWFKMLAYDLAGNSVTSERTPFTYTTSSICHNLSSGWNICANLGTDKTLTNLLTETGGTTVAFLNATNEFSTHVSGGAFSTTSVPSGSAFFTYLSAAGEYEDGLVESTITPITTLLSNQSNTDYNLAIYLNNSDDATLGAAFKCFNRNASNDSAAYGFIDPIARSNVSFMSFYNNSGSTGQKYIPSVTNRSINNDTVLTYGDTVWIFLNRADVYNMTVNWKDVNNVGGCVECNTCNVTVG